MLGFRIWLEAVVDFLRFRSLLYFWLILMKPSIPSDRDQQQGTYLLHQKSLDLRLD